MKKIFNKVMAATMATVLTIGTVGIVSARVADGTNVAKSATWTSFSICTREDGGSWEDSLKAFGQKKGIDYGTEGKIKSLLSDGFIMDVVNTGWDGEYNPYTYELVADNPWGVTATSSNIPVEGGRTYTLSFKLLSSLMNKATTSKYLRFSISPVEKKDATMEVLDTQGCDESLALLAIKDQETSAKVTFKVPNNFNGNINISFAFGAFFKSFPEEAAMKGEVKVSNFAVTANKQNKVTFMNGSKVLSEKYVNDGDVIKSMTLERKGYTFVGWYVDSSKYNFSSTVNRDLKLVAKWKKTTAPKKATIKGLKSRKSKTLEVKIKGISGVSGYSIEYSQNKNFKGKKTKTSKKATYTIKKLKSGKKYYVRVKAYKLDSTDRKVSCKKYSGVKSLIVK